MWAKSIIDLKNPIISAERGYLQRNPVHPAQKAMPAR
jgi:hypothetical protein